MSVAMADLDGDTVPDLVTANQGSDDVVVMLGNGDGTFTPGVSLPAGAYPTAVAAADVDGDHILDLVTASGDLRGSKDVNVLLGNGDGSFQSAFSYPADFGGQIVVADLNRDTVPDLVIAASLLNNVTTMLGNGDGSFQPARSFFAGDTPLAVAVGDVDSDGVADVVAPNYYDYSVSVLLGNGDGSFPDSADWFSTNYRSTDIAAVDLNGDGAIDLAAATAADDYMCELCPDYVAVLIGVGDGTFQQAVSYPVAVAVGSGVYPRSLTVGDFDGDAVLDLATANAFSNDVSVLLGNGDGTFSTGVPFPAGVEPASVATADLDGDQVLDLVTANEGSDDLSVLLGIGDGTFSSAVQFPTGSFPTSVAVADIDGDQIVDLVIAGAGGNVGVLLGIGDGTFPSPTFFAAGGYAVSLDVADVDGDTVIDVVTALGNDEIGVLRGNGDGSFQPPMTFPTGDGPGSVAVADVDGDGVLDIASAATGINAVSVLLGDSQGSFQTARSYRVLGNIGSSVAIADLDDDDLPDLAVASGGIAVLFQQRDEPAVPSMSVGGAVAIASVLLWLGCSQTRSRRSA
jgi:hypothetical protein